MCTLLFCQDACWKCTFTTKHNLKWSQIFKGSLNYYHVPLKGFPVKPALEYAGKNCGVKEEREREKWDQLRRASHDHERSKAMLCNVWWGHSLPLCPPWPLNPSWLKWVADVRAPLWVQTEGALCFSGLPSMTVSAEACTHTSADQSHKYRCLKLVGVSASQSADLAKVNSTENTHLHLQCQ